MANAMKWVKETLAPLDARQRLVERGAIDLEESRRHGAHAGRGRHREAGASCWSRSAPRHRAAASPPRRCAATGFDAGATALRRGRHAGHGRTLVVGEEFRQLADDRVGVGKKRSYMSSTSHALGPKDPLFARDDEESGGVVTSLA